MRVLSTAAQWAVRLPGAGEKPSTLSGAGGAAGRLTAHLRSTMSGSTAKRKTKSESSASVGRTGASSEAGEVSSSPQSTRCVASRSST